MVKVSQMRRTLSYIAECLHILYWVYFKPFTFQRWLRDIHPALEPYHGFLGTTADYSSNPRLRRYDKQVQLLSAVVPVAIILLIGLSYTLINSELFYWIHSSLFMLGWEIGFLLSTLFRPKLWGQVETSALKYLPRHVGPELVPLLVDMQGAAIATRLTGLAKELANQIVESARQTRNLRLPLPGIDAQDPFPSLREWLEQIEGVAKGKRFFLCLDEFERLSEVIDATQSQAPLNFLRHILQHRQQWIILFCRMENAWRTLAGI